MPDRSMEPDEEKQHPSRRPPTPSRLILTSKRQKHALCLPDMKIRQKADYTRRISWEKARIDVASQNGVIERKSHKKNFFFARSGQFFGLLSS